jgi:catechol 2,3-dioxygenase-like lactoylglutathione lyase family enzyme
MNRAIAGPVAVTISCLLAVAAAGFQALARERAGTITTVAYRVHRQAEMVAFYSEAFGVRFRAADTGGIQSQFGELGKVTLKFVPIRNAIDFQGFPIHQLGLEVPDVARVIEVATRHGGRVQDAPVRQGGHLHASVRDPDGNTLELYGPR